MRAILKEETRKEKVSSSVVGICSGCGFCLTNKRTVRRTYHLPDDGCVDAYGHYTHEGDFEPDSVVSVSMEGAQTYDGDDSCFRCDRVVG